MEKSESIKELATALCKFQGAVETIKKSEVNPFFKSKYADLSSILDVIRQPLADNGLSFVQFPSGKYGLDTMLMHTSGEWISQSYEMKPLKESPQDAGSVITYQRRYALGAILGLNIDIDDDGNKGSQEPKAKSEPEAKRQATRDLATVYTQLAETKTLADIVKLWNDNPKIHTDSEVVNKFTERKLFLKD